jgi:hypothetical protein
MALRLEVTDSLRWHYPDQVRGSADVDVRTLSAVRSPVGYELVHPRYQRAHDLSKIADLSRIAVIMELGT